MVREGLAIGALTGETVVAMDGLGRKRVGAIHGHQPLVAKDPNMRQQAVLFEALKDLNKHGIDVARCDRITQRADLIVTGNVLYAHQGMGIIVACVLLQGAWGVQKRWRLGEKDAKGASGGIADAVLGVWSFFAMIGQLIDPLV